MTTLFHHVRHYVCYCLLGVLWPMIATAGISLDATRLIMTPADQGRGVTIGVVSEAESLTPYLVKVKISRDLKGNQTEVPFWVTPPIFRLDPGGKQQLRVTSTQANFVPDREQVFYLSASALPASTNTDNTNNTHSRGQLIVATGTIIKLFYRPNGLPMTHRDAMSQLQFTHTGATLVVKNPTPYYITLIGVLIGNKSLPAMSKTENKGMIAPFSEVTYYHVPTSPGPIKWVAINDYGGNEEFSNEGR